MKKKTETGRPSQFWIRRDGMFLAGSISETYWESNLTRAIRRDPAGTFRAIGDEVYSRRADRAMLLPKPQAERVAAKVGGEIELF